ncbi:hypothetical protein VIGAN_01494100, partial [Vigna angularis var. angularis]
MSAYELCLVAKVMISNRVITGFGRGSSEEQDVRFTYDEIRVLRVLSEPILALLVPIIDFGTKGKGSLGVEGLLVVRIGGVDVGSNL